MGLIELLLLGIGLSMDAFAVSICKGIETKKAGFKQVMLCGVWFGFFQGLMPFIGYVLGSRLEFIINKVAPWLAFILLTIIGVNMLREAFSSEEEDTRAGFDVKSMFILAVATSIDALAVGITFVAVPVTLVKASALLNTVIGCLIIMATTFVFSSFGVKIGNAFGTRFKSGAEAAGGFVLIFIGLKILLEHLGALEFLGKGDVVFGLLIPFVGTVLGSALVFITDSEIKEDFKLIMMGMAGGIMMACAMWTLLYPSILRGKIVTAAVGFIIGIGFQYLLDKVVPHTHVFTKAEEGPSSSLKYPFKVMLSEVIHHVPEGMAVGIMFAGALNGAEGMSLAAAFALTIGIAVQNIPEGIFVSNPIRTGGEEKSKSFLMGVVSGAVEPLLGIVMMILITAFPGIQMFVMSLTAGAIAFLVLEENIPSMHTGEHSDKGTISFMLFFCLMMVITFSTAV
ncbi:manganese efflux pump [Butyrivibrio sp. AE3004]|uniref:manganese efflux pump n=1 Tax=Butyrivibrio sp. AE3004 TaxID=1506994 RepID=UPI0009DF6A0B|nr:manganese efflux pump [Butyrivibrio sp. AE3004]